MQQEMIRRAIDSQVCKLADRLTHPVRCATSRIDRYRRDLEDGLRVGPWARFRLERHESLRGWRHAGQLCRFRTLRCRARQELVKGALTDPPRNHRDDVWFLLECANLRAEA